MNIKNMREEVWYRSLNIFKLFLKYCEKLLISFSSSFSCLTDFDDNFACICLGFLLPS